MSVVVNPGGGGSAVAATQGVAVINPSDWTYTAGDYEVRKGALYLARPVLYTSPTTLSTGSPGARREIINTSRFSAGSIASGVLSLTTDNSGGDTFWTIGSQTCLGCYLGVDIRANPEKRQFLISRLENAAGTNGGQGPRLGFIKSGSLATFSNIGITSDGGGGYSLVSLINGSSGGATAIGGISSLVLAVEVVGGDAAVWYATPDGNEIPTSGWTRYHSSTGAFSEWDLLRGSIVYVSKSQTLTGESENTGLWEAPLLEASDVEAWPGGALRPVWTPTADLFDTSAPVASIQVPVSASATIAAADLQDVLTNAVVWDSADITVRARRGSAPSGSYTAISSLALEAGSGADLYIDVKMTSDGYRPVGLRQGIIPTS